jgi:hypothetical protein
MTELHALFMHINKLVPLSSPPAPRVYILSPQQSKTLYPRIYNTNLKASAKTLHIFAQTENLHLRSYVVSIANCTELSPS